MTRLTFVSNFPPPHTHTHTYIEFLVAYYLQHYYLHTIFYNQSNSVLYMVSHFVVSALARYTASAYFSKLRKHCKPMCFLSSAHTRYMYVYIYVCMSRTRVLSEVAIVVSSRME
jgi:hypothetical protein